MRVRAATPDFEKSPLCDEKEAAVSSGQPFYDPGPEARPAGFRCTVQAEAPDAIRLMVRGELDLLTAPQLADAFADAPPLALLILDLSELTFIDSSGLHAILAGRALLAEAGCRLVLAPAGHHVQRVFEITGTNRLLEFVGPGDTRAPRAVRSS